MKAEFSIQEKPWGGTIVQAGGVVDCDGCHEEIPAGLFVGVDTSATHPNTNMPLLQDINCPVCGFTVNILYFKGK